MLDIVFDGSLQKSGTGKRNTQIKVNISRFFNFQIKMIKNVSQVLEALVSKIVFPCQLMSTW